MKQQKTKDVLSRRWFGRTGTMNTGKRAGLVAGSLFSAAVIAGACGSGGLEPSVMNVYGTDANTGYIYISTSTAASRLGSNAAKGSCDISISAGALDSVNVTSDKLDSGVDSNCGLTASDAMVTQLTLPTFETSSSPYSAKFSVADNQFRVNDNYQDIYASEGTRLAGTTVLYHPGLIDEAIGYWCDEEAKDDQVIDECFEVSENTVRTGYVDDFAIGKESIILTNRDWSRLRFDGSGADDTPLYFQYDATKDPYHIDYLRFNTATYVITPKPQNPARIYVRFWKNG